MHSIIIRSGHPADSGWNDYQGKAYEGASVHTYGNHQLVYCAMPALIVKDGNIGAEGAEVINTNYPDFAHLERIVK